MATTLFDKSIAYSDPDYTALVENPHKYKKQRDFVDRLWQIYAPFADSHFETEIRKSFHQRYWEMYLTCSLIDQGFTVTSSDKGPDVHITKKETSCWVEAIAATQGTGADAVPALKSNAKSPSRVPNDKIILRLTSAFSEKFKKYQKYLAVKIVKPDDPYIIAINGQGVPFWQMPPNIPRVVSAVLPFGDQFVTINKNTMKVVDEGFQHQPEIKKQSGSGVPTTAFENAKFAGVSAVLYSTAHAWSIPKLELGHLTHLVHNPLAKNPIPKGMIAVDYEWWVNKDWLMCKG